MGFGEVATGRKCGGEHRDQIADLEGWVTSTINARLAGSGVILYELGPNWRKLGGLSALAFVTACVATFSIMASGGTGTGAVGEEIGGNY